MNMAHTRSLASLLIAASLASACTSAALAQPASAPSLSPQQLAERATYRRAVEAAIWGMPLVNTDAMRQAYFRDVGANYNDICYFSKPADWRFQVTTPNASTNYVYFNFNLKDGPVVVEVPAAVGAGLVGGFTDAWDTPVADVGPKGEDGGKGGKYLMLPPDFKGDAPSGFIALRYSTYNGYALLRAVPNGSTQADVDASLALVKKLRVYALAKRDNAPEQRFIDIHGKTFDGIADYDERFFDSLNRMIQEEPVQPRDLVMMGMLTTIGIEKGKEFKPDAETRRLLSNAAQEAQAGFVNALNSFSQPWWPDRKWSPPDIRGVKTGFTFVTDNSIDLDARGLSNYAAFGFPKKTGESIVYLVTFRDNRGERLSGERNYALHVPANVPAGQYWSVIVYDVMTGGFIRESPQITRDSYNQAMKRNADGSVDIYFGPQPPMGKEANWIYTAPGKAYFPGFRFYDPQKPLLDKAWKLEDMVRSD